MFGTLSEGTAWAWAPENGPQKSWSRQQQQQSMYKLHNKHSFSFRLSEAFVKIEKKAKRPVLDSRLV
jgi:hypothetical protein